MSQLLLLKRGRMLETVDPTQQLEATTISAGRLMVSPTVDETATGDTVPEVKLHVQRSYLTIQRQPQKYLQSQCLKFLIFL